LGGVLILPAAPPPPPAAPPVPSSKSIRSTLGCCPDTAGATPGALEGVKLAYSARDSPRTWSRIRNFISPVRNPLRVLLSIKSVKFEQFQPWYTCTPQWNYSKKGSGGRNKATGSLVYESSPAYRTKRLIPPKNLLRLRTKKQTPKP
jgi:hypothetical protein